MPSLRHQRDPWPSSVVRHPVTGGPHVLSMWPLDPDPGPPQLAGPPPRGLPGEVTLLV